MSQEIPAGNELEDTIQRREGGRAEQKQEKSSSLSGILNIPGTQIVDHDKAQGPGFPDARNRIQRDNNTEKRRHTIQGPGRIERGLSDRRDSSLSARQEVHNQRNGPRSVGGCD